MINKYITVMFPYPSGQGLHIGHWYNYAIVDSYCKLQRFVGNEVFQPFGYDSFGLPAENYAKKVNRDPKEVTEENIINFDAEISRMETAFSFKFSTHTEQYQKRTQWLFTELHKKDLAYKAIREQEWCPSCATVLAKEQVVNGKCERCETVTERKELLQWFFRITEYKQRLIDDLQKVDYPEKTKKQQIHWLNNLTDWCVSRQRKWGCSIPIEGELDTLDTFVDSSFYTIEYDKSRPVDIYVGGNEHACLHLIYSRFICKFLFDIGYVDFDEPFKRVIHQGMITKDGHKMSKSKGNTVDPTGYEPQILKMYLMFINHYFDGGDWKDDGYKGCLRFDRRFKLWIGKSSNLNGERLDISEFKQTTTNYFLAWKTNKVVSEWMTFYNANRDKTIDLSTARELIEFYNVCF